MTSRDVDHKSDDAQNLSILQLTGLLLKSFGKQKNERTIPLGLKESW